MRTALKLLTVLGQGGLPYLIRDEFTDTRAAGAVNGTLATPGPGTRAAVDTNSQLTIGGGVANFAGGKAIPAWGDPVLHETAITRAIGTAVLAKFNRANITTYFWVGFGNATDDVNPNTAGTGGPRFLFNNSAALQIFPEDSVSNLNVGLTTAAQIAAATDYHVAIVQQTAGNLYLIKGGTFTSWTLVYATGTGANATLYPMLANYDGVQALDWLRTAQLPAPFTTDYGIATTRLAGARAANDTGSHEADALLEFTVGTVPSGGQADFRFRRQDATNYWSVTVDSSGNLDLDEVVAGVVTQRGTSAGVIANGDRIVIATSGVAIRVYEANMLRITYASATNFATATTFLLADEGTGGAVTNIVTWPRTLSGQALATLNAYTA